MARSIAVINLLCNREILRLNVTADVYIDFTVNDTIYIDQNVSAHVFGNLYDKGLNYNRDLIFSADPLIAIIDVTNFKSSQLELIQGWCYRPIEVFKAKSICETLKLKFTSIKWIKQIHSSNVNILTHTNSSGYIDSIIVNDGWFD